MALYRVSLLTRYNYYKDCIRQRLMWSLYYASSMDRCQLCMLHSGLSNQNRRFSNSPKNCNDASKSLLDNMLNVIQQKDLLQSSVAINKGSPRNKSQVSKSKSQHQTKSSKRIRQLLPHLFTEDNGGVQIPITVEKQLMGLMQLWEMEEAVTLLKESVLDGIEPDRTVVLNLLQQLANLGEVECLLELHEFLKDRGLSTNLKFYHCLRDAYFNSGRIEEGVLMLRIIYHGNRDFEDTDLFFTLLATMTARHFVHQLPLIESFVTDLEEGNPPITSARASLWRCLILAERFDLADVLVEEHEEIKKLLPAQVTKIIQSQLEVDFDRDKVVSRLMNSPLVKPGLAASLFDMLILYKSNCSQWSECLELLSQAMGEGRKIQPRTVEMFLSRFLNQLSQEQVSELSGWAASLQQLTPDNEEP